MLTGVIIKEEENVITIICFTFTENIQLIFLDAEKNTIKTCSETLNLNT